MDTGILSLQAHLYPIQMFTPSGKAIFQYVCRLETTCFDTMRSATGMVSFCKEFRQKATYAARVHDSQADSNRLRSRTRATIRSPAFMSTRCFHVSTARTRANLSRRCLNESTKADISFNWSRRSCHALRATETAIFSEKRSILPSRDNKSMC